MRKRISLKYCDKTLLYELLDSNNHDYKERYRLRLNFSKTFKNEFENLYICIL